jgi:hypothetical protein
MKFLFYGLNLITGIMEKNPAIDLTDAFKDVWDKFEQLPTPAYAGEIAVKVKHLLLLTNALHLQNVPVNDWNLWTEPVIFKLCYHVTSLLQLLAGTQLPYEQNGRNVLIFDEPSIFVLFRTALENYLTFYYLFIDNVPDQEKQFRMLVWKYSAVKQRSEFKIDNDEESQRRLDEEKQTAEKYRQQLEDSANFKNMTAKEKGLILKGKKSRLVNGWQTIVESAKLNSGIFRNLYSYKSSYSHSEFLSILQIKMGGYGFNPKAKAHYLTIIIHALVCKTIVDLTKLFPVINQEFQRLPDGIRKEILYLNVFCMNHDAEIKCK